MAWDGGRLRCCLLVRRAASLLHLTSCAGALLSRAPFTPQMLLPAVAADGQSPAEAVAAMNALCPAGTALLHLAVGTGSVPLVSALAGWGRATGHAWQVDAQEGAASLTPLHLAALLPNVDQMRAALAAMAPTTNKLWGMVQAHDGTTPEALAEALAAAAVCHPAPPPSLPSACSTGTLAELGPSKASSSKVPSAAARRMSVEVPLGSLASTASPLQEAGVLEGEDRSVLCCVVL